MNTTLLNHNQILEIIQLSVNNLHKSEIIPSEFIIASNTNLFGNDSGIDSMGFVALISDVEDAVNKCANSDIYIVLTDIEEMFPLEKNLTAGMLADYLITILKA